MKWVTRERPKTDRIACPWLIRRFIDPEAEFLYVPAERVLEVAEAEGALSFDAPGARFTHRDGLCSFEVLVEEYAIDDPAVQLLARIVHGADVARGSRRDAAVARAARDRRGIPPARARRPPPARAVGAGLRRARTPGADDEVGGASRLTADARRILAIQALRAFSYGFGSVVLGVSLAASDLSGTEVGIVLARDARRLGAGVVLRSRATETALGRRRTYAGLLVVMGDRRNGVRAHRLSAGAPPRRADRDALDRRRRVGPVHVARAGDAPGRRGRARPDAPLRHVQHDRDAAPGRSERSRRSLPALLGDVEQRWLLVYPAAATLALARRDAASRARSRPASTRDAMHAPLASLASRSQSGSLRALRARLVRRWVRHPGLHRLLLRDEVRDVAATLGVVFFALGILQAVSFQAAVRLARRIGLLRTMVFTHLPSNVLLAAIAFAPTQETAIALLLARSLLSQMDVPRARRTSSHSSTRASERRRRRTRTAPVCRSPVRTAPDRPARSVGLGAPFVAAGALKSVYDLSLSRTSSTPFAAGLDSRD